MRTRIFAFFSVVCLLSRALATQPLVAIHDSEFTRALATMPAFGATPTGPGTTGYQWWVTNWNYFLMPETVEESLRSDGTAYQVVGDSNIISGQLLDSNGLPAYPIVISLASEAISDSEIAQLTNYVAAGGFLFIGSSAFTRETNGVSRGDFAFADAMGVHMTTNILNDWVDDEFFTKVADNRIVQDIPDGTLQWLAPISAHEVNYGISPNHRPNVFHLIWQVVPGDATVLAVGGTYSDPNLEGSPYLLLKHFGKGYFIYDAAMEPLLGHNGFFPGMYTYMIFREAIEWAFEADKLPIPKLSPWPYPYNAAVVFRHDMEDFPSFINPIEDSAEYEHSVGAHGDYYFCTGALRTEYTPTDQSNEIASLKRAITLYGATIGSHNGGLPNITNPALATNDYDYWHWGPDEVLDVTNPPPGFSNGTEYAFISISNSFADLEGWGLTNDSGLREFEAPNFNGDREASKQILQQLGVAASGEEKLTPFPHWTLSAETAGLRYSYLSLPPSGWFINGILAQSVEDGHTTNTIHALINFYYNLGALIDLYCHSSSAGGPGFSVQGIPTYPDMEKENVTYSMNTNLFPRMWSANADSIYRWWVKRSTVHIVPTSTRIGNQSVTTISVTGSSDTNTAIEVLAATPAYYGVQVYTNGFLTDTNNYRIIGQTIRVLAGAAVTNVEIRYSLAPAARDDAYYVQPGNTLTVAAPGVLANDLTGWGTNLTAQLVTGPTNGILNLNSDGSFTYTPTNNFIGTDIFTYEANDGQTNSTPATVSILVANPPTINSGPTNVTADAGATVTFNVIATNSLPLTYQWFQNGTNALTDGGTISGSSTPTLTITGVLGGNAGGYTVVVSNPAGSVTSAPPAVLTVTDPIITAPPNGAVQNNGHNVELSVGALGSEPLNYQWFLNGQSIAGATNAVEILMGVTNGAAGSYSVVVSNAFGSVTGIVASLQTYDSGLLFSDDFTRATNPGSIFPWVAAIGTWTVTNQTLGVTGLNSSIANAYVPGTNWGDYSLQGDIRFPAGSYGGGLGGHVDSTTGAHYGVWIYPEGSPGNADTLTLIKFFDWTDWSGNPMAQVALTNGVGTNWHSLNLTFRGDEIIVYYDGNQVADVTDDNFDGVAPYLSGGITADEWAPSPAQAMIVSNMVVSEFSPTITNQPQDAATGSGNDAAFTVTAGGTTPLSYQWFKDGVALTEGGNIYGSTTSDLLVSNVSTLDAGLYSVVVSNAFGIALSSNALLTVTNPPVIISQPTNTVAAAGGTASFSVQAVGSALQYQWLKDSNPLIGATNSTLILNNISDTDGGLYSVIVSNLYGSVFSSNATLTVDDCFSPPSGLVGWWPGEGNADDIAGTNNGVLVGGTTADAPGVVGTAFHFDGVDSAVQIPNAPELNPSNLTVECWVRFDTLDAPSDGGYPGQQYLVFKQNSRSGNFEGFELSKDRYPPYQGTNDTFCFEMSSAAGDLVFLESQTVIQTNVWYYVAGVRGPNYIQLYVNGQLEAQTNIDFPQDYGNEPLYFGASGQSYYNPEFAGSLDEVSLYNRPLSSNEIEAIYLAGLAGKCKTPGIISQPASRTNYFGTTASFAVVAEGANPLSYQWIKDGTNYLSDGGNVSGATSSLLTINNLGSGDSGDYSVEVSNAYGAVVSSNAVLTVGVIHNGPALPNQTNRVVDEQTLLVVTNTAIDDDMPPLPLSYTLGVVTVTNQAGNSEVTNAAISTNGVISWTPSEAQGPGAYVLTTVVSDGTYSATNNFQVTVNEVNTAPVLPSQTNITISGTASIVVTNTGSDSDIPVNPLGYQLTGPVGATIDTNGVIRWTPTVSQVPGVYTFTTVVTDTNVYAMSAQDLSATNSFTVTVNAIHNPPILVNQTNRVVNELTLLAVTNTASENDVPPLPLNYTLGVETVTNQVGNSQVTNAVISTNGVINWTPSEAQGPGVYVLTTVVSDGSLSATNSFQVAVNELNTAPVLPSQTNVSISGTASLVVTNTASDSDIPVNPLGYQLSGPAGATIDTNGVIQWTPMVSQVPGVYTFTTVVTDTNVFAVNAQDLSATNSFTVTVNIIHNGPALPNQTNRVVAEETQLVVTNTAIDADVPPLPLTYSLGAVTVTNQVGNSQVTNAAISTNGVISWTPSEAQGPGVYVLTTVVGDGTYSATNSFQVTVNEVNTAPVLPNQNNLTISGLTPVVVTNTASDSDIPINPLSYQLITAPTGATVDTNGVIYWLPTVNQIPGVYTFTTVVTDTNVFAVNAQDLSATNSFTVTVAGPAITGQPTDVIAAAGGRADFVVQAVGDALEYQWLKAATPLAGATNATLTLTNLSDGDAGIYSVIVSNAYGSVLSSNATLTVDDCFSPPSGLVGWWPAEGNADDIAGTNNGALEGGATANAPGVVGTAFHFDGTNSLVQIPNAPELNPSNLTIEAWVRFDSLNTPAVGAYPGEQYIVFKQNSRSGNFEGFALSKDRYPPYQGTNDTFSFTVTSAQGNSAFVESKTVIATNVWYYVAAVRGPNYIQMYVNGQLQAQSNVDFPQDYGTKPLYFGSSGETNYDEKFAGSLDEVSLYNRALSSNEIEAIYLARVAGKCKTPAIVSQPASRTNSYGTTASFTVVAHGTSLLGYQWIKNGTNTLTNGGNISGATNATLTISNVSSADAGSYSVLVDNAYGAAISSNATLAVTQAVVTITSGITADNKVYDGTAAATLTTNNVALNGVLAGDATNVGLSTNGYVATFSSADVGTNVEVMVSGLTLTGSAAENYTLSQPTGLAANITSKEVTITSGITANNKMYDGTAAAALATNNVVLNGVLAGDAANVGLSTNGYVAIFNSAGVGTGIPVTVSGLTLTGSAAGNYTLTQPTGLTANIAGRNVTITSGIAANNKVYDGTTATTITSNTVVLNGVLAGDTANVHVSTNGYVATFNGADVGTGVPVTVSGLTLTGSAAGNYTLTQPTGLTANITGKGLTITSGVTADNKVYDGTAAATLTTNDVVLNGVLAGDVTNVGLSTNGYVATFNSANVGTNITVTVNGLTLTGSAAGNYTLNQPAGLTANITGKDVTITFGIAADSKVYDGTTAATITSNTVVLNGVLAGDVANVELSTNGYTATFNSANVGTNIAVTVSGLTLTGSASGNYTLNQPTGLTANITGKGVTITSGITANNKVYDGTTAATITSNTVALNGVLAGDVANVGLSTNSYVATFNSANVGTNIAVTVSGLTLTGSAAGNYALSQPSGLTANITGKGVTIVSGIAANNKVYDGTTAATITSNTVVLNGVLAGDTANVQVSTNGYVATFNSANVGTNITVTVSGITLTGSAAGNYTLTQPTGLTANITGKGVTIASGIAANNKLYDGTIEATITSNTVVLNGVLAGDTANVHVSTNGYVATFNSASVGTNITVTVSGLTLTGSAAGNYTLNQPTGLTANITGKGVTIASGITANNKVYDGTIAATITSNTVVLNGVLAGDTANVHVSTNGYVATFNSASVGTNMTVTVSGLTLTGSATGNYTLNQPTGLTANITGVVVTITSGISANNKAYDGSTAATLTTNNVVLNGVLPVDAGNIRLSTNGYVANFTNASVGNNIPVTVSGLTLTGSAAGNYTLSQPTGLTANITGASVTIVSGITVNNKVYDRTAAATLTTNNVLLSGVLAADTANVKLSTNGYVAIFNTANVGTNIPVTISGLTLTGNAATNYTLTQPTGLTANITPKLLTIVAVPSPVIMSIRMTNGIATVVWTSVTNGVYRVQYRNDLASGAWNDMTPDVTATGLSATQTDNALGLSARFYRIMVPHPSFAANNKMYDGTATATISSNNVALKGVLNGDIVGVLTNGYTANFVSPNVGAGIPVTLTGLTLTGPDAGNYTLSQPVMLSANITPVTLTVSAVNQSRTAGLPNPPLTVNYSGFVNSEGTNVLSGAPSVSTIANTNSAPGPYPITVSIGTLSAANYIFTFVNGTLTVVAVPQLNGVTLSGNQFVFSWSTIVNQTYQLQYKDDLGAANWIPLGSPMPGTGSAINVTNLLGASPQRFFRLVVSP